MPRTLSQCSEGVQHSLFFVDPDPHYCVGTKFPDPMTHQAREEQHCARVLIELLLTQGFADPDYVDGDETEVLWASEIDITYVAFHNKLDR